jgi:phosphoribosylanthranilate isomerase
MKKIIKFVKMFLGFAKETTTDIKEISNEVLEIVEISNKIEEEKITEIAKEEKLAIKEVEPITEEATPAPKKAKKRYYPKKKNK